MASALMAPVKDGQIVETNSQSSLKKVTEAGKDMDKEAFLQLLVAQMQYQDPLQPTSNTEYIAQYAQFSQVEQIQNMAHSMDLQRASGLVGKEVYIKTTNSEGETNYVRGKVDYVTYESNKAYLAINEELYSIDDLDSIVDIDYQNAYDKATDFVTRLNRLPHVNGVDMSDVEEIEELEKIYEEMNDYEKTFIAKEKVDALKEYVQRAEDLKVIHGVTDGEEDEGSEGDTEGNQEEAEGAGEV